MSLYSWLACIACAARYDAKERRYHCECGELLEVRHDLERLRHDHRDLKALFNARWGATEGIYRSGVWRYHELILPDLPATEIVTKPEGNTRLYRTEALSRGFGLERLYLKHEGENPTLSFKDRGMTAGVSWAKHIGMTHVACASTGDTSAALAAYAAEVATMQGLVFLPHGKISREQLAQALTYGALTLALDTDFDGCMRLVGEVCRQRPIYLLNSMNSLRIEGQKAIGLEALQQLRWNVPDWFVIPVGNAGNLSALGKGLAEAHALGIIDRLPRIAGIQASAANPFYLSYREQFAQRVQVTAQPTQASAIRIGAPVSHHKARRVIEQFGGLVEQVSEVELMEAKTIADRAGVSVCPNSGVALAGVRRLLAQGEIRATDTVVAIMTAHGLKFSACDYAYNTGEWPELSPARPNAPLRVAAELPAILEQLDRRVEKRC
jgi:threonine synthase